MHPFDYVREKSVSEAMTAGGRTSAKFIAGGTNLVDLMKANVERPAHVVDINALPLGGVLTLRGPNGERKVIATDFHLLPGNTPHFEHDLKRGELIVSLFLPDAPHAQRSSYLKVRDRTSYEFALASAAVGLHIEGGVIRSARIAFGGIATKPWRARFAEAVLFGKPSPKMF